MLLGAVCKFSYLLALRLFVEFSGRISGSATCFRADMEDVFIRIIVDAVNIRRTHTHMRFECQKSARRRRASGNEEEAWSLR